MKRSFMTRALAFCLSAALLLGNVAPAYAAEANTTEPQILETGDETTLSSPVISEVVEEETEQVDEPQVQQYEPISYVHVNPLYADIISEEDILAQAAIAMVSEDVTYYTSIDDAAMQMRTDMVNRTTTISVGYEYEGEYDGTYAQSVSSEIAEKALEHTGVATEGDYLKWQYGGYQSSIGASMSGGVVSLTITYTVSYYTSAEQEAELTAAIEEWLPLFQGETEFDTIQNIYNHLYQNVTYDNDNLKDDSYLLKYTAYAAMVNGTSVCQGFAVLFYRLALECGIDARVITGDAGGAHAWNIVKLNDLYYNLDATWDSGADMPIWFLLSDEDFTEHTRDEAYLSESFMAQYPMAAESYVIDENPEDNPTDDPNGDGTEGVPPIDEGEADENSLPAPSMEVILDEDGDFVEIQVTNNASEYVDIETGIISADLTEDSKLYAYSSEIEAGESDTLSVSTIANYVVDYHRPEDGEYYFYVYARNVDTEAKSELVVLEEYPITIENSVLAQTTVEERAVNSTYYFTDFTPNDYIWAAYWIQCNDDSELVEEHHIANAKQNIYYADKEYLDYEYDEWTFSRVAGISYDLRSDGCTFNICSATNFVYEEYDESQISMPSFSSYFEEGKFENISIHNNDGDDRYIYYGFATKDEIETGIELETAVGISPSEWTTKSIKDLVAIIPSKAGEYYLVAYAEDDAGYRSKLAVCRELPFVVKTVGSDETVTILQGSHTGELRIDGISPEDYLAVDASFLLKEYIDDNPEDYTFSNLEHPFDDDDWDSFFISGSSMKNMKNACDEWSLEQLRFKNANVFNDICKVTITYNEEIVFETFEETVPEAPILTLAENEDGTVTSIKVQNSSENAGVLWMDIFSREEIENGETPHSGWDCEGFEEIEVLLENLLCKDVGAGTYYVMAQFENDETWESSKAVVLEDFPIVVEETEIEDTYTYRIGDVNNFYYFMNLAECAYAMVNIQCTHSDDEDKTTPLRPMNGYYYFNPQYLCDEWSFKNLKIGTFTATLECCNVSNLIVSSFKEDGVFDEPEAEAPTLALHRDDNGNIVGVAITNNISHDNGIILMELVSQDEEKGIYLKYGRMDGEATSIYLFEDFSPYFSAFQNLEEPISLKFVCTAEDPEIGLHSKEIALNYPINLEFNEYSGDVIPVYKECTESAGETLYKFYVDAEKLPTGQTTYWLKYTAAAENGDYNQVYYSELLLTDDGKHRYANVYANDDELSVDGIIYRKLLITDTNMEIQQGAISEEKIIITDRDLSRKQVLLLDYDYYNAFIASGGSVTVEDGKVVISTDNFIDTVKWTLEYLHQWFEGTGLYRFVKNITNAVKEDANKYWKSDVGSFKAKNYYDIDGNEISEDTLSNHDIVLIEYAPEIVWVDSMELTAPETMALGEEATVEVTLDAGQDKYPFGRTPQVRFESSDSEILEVDAETGALIAGTKAGTVTITAYADEDLRAEEGLTEIVTASVEITVGDEEPEVPEVPEQIVGVLAVGDVSGISLNWGISSEVDTETYRIYRKIDDGEFSLLKEISGRNTLTYFDKDVEFGKVYFYYVVGVGKFNQEGVPSATVQASKLTDQVAPVVTQLLPSNGSVLTGTVVMGLLSEDNLAVTKAELHCSVDNGETWSLLSESADGTFNVNIDTTQFADGNLQLKGLAYDANGNVSNPLIYKYIVDNMGPDQVQGVAAEATSVTITLRWNDVEAEDIQYFVVEEKSANGQYAEIQKVYNTLGANIYGLTPATTYIYRVVGYDRQGNRGTASDEIVVMTKADDMVPVITMLSPTFSYQRDTIELSARAKDEYNVAKMTLQISKNGTEWMDVCTESYNDICAERTLSYTLSLAEYSEGYLFYRAVAEDAAGHVSDTSKDAPFVQYVVDRTAPEAPQNVQAENKEGYIEVSWSMGKEKDLGTYSLYRSEEENGTYELVRSNLSSLNCIDRNIESGKTYYYQVVVNDLAGNQSEYSAIVSAQATPDTQKPEVLSISPAGEYVGPEYKTIGVAAQDNNALESVLIEYSKDNVVFETLVEKTELSTHSLTVTENLPIDGMNDGDVIYVRVSVTDQSGNVGDMVSAQYIVDKTAPVLQDVTVEYTEEKVVLNWTGSQETDLAGYRIYRAAGTSDDYSLLRQYAAVEGQSEYSYIDQNLATVKTTYKYKVEAVDLYGNTYHVLSDSVEVAGTTNVSKVNLPEAIISCDPTFEVGVEYYVDASLSTDSEGIVSYHFDFGDGTESTLKKAVHKYDKVGDYTITLTVEDEDGNIATCKKQISVKERTFIGAARIKVVDANGVAVPGASVYFNLGEENELVKKTDGQGYATFSATVGRHTVGCIIPDNEWLPTKKDIIVLAGDQTEVTMTMVQHTMIEGEFEIKRMTFEEIVAAGIDVTAPENQYIVKVNVQLEYGTETIDTSFNYNETTGQVIGDPIIWEDRELIPHIIPSGGGGGNSGGGGYGGDYEFSKECTIAFLDVPIGVSALKEFFDVRLHIINNASAEFSMIDNMIELDVPAGLSLVETYTSEGKSVSIGEIKGQTTETITWILRGDEVGAYKIAADYSGILALFNETIHTRFESSEPLIVRGLSELKMRVEIPEALDRGTFYYNVMLINEGRLDVYRPNIDTEDILLETLVFDETGTRNVLNNTIDAVTLSKLGIGTNISGNLNILGAGYSLMKHYMSVNQTEYTEQVLKLKKYTYEVQNTYGLEIEFVEKPVSYFKSNLNAEVNAVEKAERTFKEGQSDYEALMNNQNYIYEQLYSGALEGLTDKTDEIGWDLLGVAIGKAELKDLFGGDNEEAATEILLDAMQIAAESSDFTKFKIACDWTEAIAAWAEEKDLSKTEDAWVQKITSFIQENVSDITEEQLKEMVVAYGEALKETYRVISVEHKWETYYTIFEGEYLDWDRMVIEKWQMILEEQFSETTIVLEETELSALMRNLCSEESFEKVWNAVGIGGDAAGLLVNTAEKASADMSLYLAAQGNIESYNLFLDTIIKGDNENGSAGNVVKNAASQVKKIINDQDLIGKLAARATDEAFWYMVEQGKEKVLDEVDITPSALVKAIKAVLEITYEVGNNVFNVDERYEIADNIRYVSAIADNLAEGIESARKEYETYTTESYALPYMQLISYLIEMRRIGESQTAQFGVSYEVLPYIFDSRELFEAVKIESGAVGANSWYEWRDVVEDRISIIRANLLSNPVAQDGESLTKPVVSFNYAKGQTVQKFSNIYEYSLDGGMSWIDCTGEEITLKPATCVRELQVRRKDVSDSTEKRTASLMIYGIPSIDKSGIQVLETENGYRFKNLDNHKIYEVAFSNEKNSYTYEDILGFAIPEGLYSFEYETNETYEYVYIRTLADSNQFASYIYSAPMYPMKTVSVEVDGKGSVVGAGNFENGEEVTLIAQPSEHYKFVGWYQGEALVNDKSVYTFKALESVSLSAKFVFDANSVVWVSAIELVVPQKIEIGETATITATPVPADGKAFDNAPELRFESSAPDVLSINAKTGEFTALKLGTAVITVYADEDLRAEAGLTDIVTASVTIQVVDVHEHVYDYELESPATFETDGKLVGTCSCEEVTDEKLIYKAASVELSETSYIYDGEDKQPEVTVKDSQGTALKPGTDYNVSYKNNNMAGTATATITLIGNYSGTKEVDFIIKQRSLVGAVVADIAPQVYTGSAIEPEVYVNLGELNLTLNDYTVSYASNINKGTAVVTVTGTGNYYGTAIGTFEITARELEESMVAPIGTFEYTGKAIEPEVTVTFGETKLVEGTDYTVLYSNNMNVGTATVTVNGTGNFAGTVTAHFGITAKELEESMVAEIASCEYTGEAVEPVVTVTYGAEVLTAGKDFTAVYTNNVNVGTANVTITGKGDYSGTVETTFEITPKAITPEMVEDFTSHVYTGKEIKAEVVVKDGEKVLAEGTDYTVGYGDNVNVGNANVVVTGKGNYDGIVEAIFEIAPKEIDTSMLGTVASVTYTGEAIESEVVVTFGETELISETDYTVSYTNNINAGTAIVIVNGKGNFTGTAETSFEITPKMLEESMEVKIDTQEYTGAEVKPAVVITDNEKTLVAGVDFTVEYSNNVELGTATAEITGTGNYTGSLTANFTITERILKSSMIAAIGEQIYNGGDICPEVVITVDGITLVEDLDYTVEYFDNVEAGKATITVTGLGNYAGNVTVNFTIKGKTLTASMIEEIMPEEYTGKALKPDVFLNDNDLDVSLEEGIDYTVSYSNNVNAGTATVKVIGKGNYAGTVTKTFKIEAREIGNCAVTVTEKMTYTGKTLIPTVTVKDAGTTLKNGTAYTISYSANKNPGEAIVKITGKGNYTGTVEESFVIVPKKATMNSVTASSSVEGRLTVKWTKDSLADGYMLQYSTDKGFDSGVETEIIEGAGTTSMTLSGLKEGKTYYVRVASFVTVDDDEYRGSYSSAKSAKTKKGFSVKAIAEQDYTGKALKPKVTVKNGSTTLKEGTDYTVSYSNNTKPGEATVKVKGRGNYAGTEVENFIIVPKEATLKSVTSTGVGKLKVKWSKDSLASGYILQYSTSSKFSSSKTVTLDITKYSTVSKTIKGLTEGKTYYVRVAAYKTIDGEDFLGSYSTKDSVKVKASFTVKAISDKTYTGSSIEPSVTVKFGSKTLKKGTDYTVSYSSNKNPGTATVKVTGKGNYAGTEKVTFKIVPKKATITTVKSTKAGRLTVKWEKDAKADGYFLQYSTSKKFTEATTETIYIKKYSTVSKTIKNLVSGKKYYVRVAAYKNIDDVMERGSYSSVKYLKVK